MEEGLTSSVVMTQVRRWLGSNDDYFISDSSTRAPSNLEHRHKGDSFEFFAFLLWYMFLVVCCVLPTFCAYRRRRQMARLAERQSQLILQNAVFFSNLRLSASAEEARQRSLCTERTKSITQALKETSFTVTKDVIVTNRDESVGETEKSDSTTLQVDTELGAVVDYYESMDDSLLQLPADAVNGDRSVPGGCAICLESYEPGDRVTWSKFDSCKHAFHHDCVIQWLSQKEDDQPLCPCCRQDFCSVPGNVASNNSHQYPTRETLVTAATLSDFIRMRQAEFMLPITTTTDDGTVSITSLPTEQFATSANETAPPNENDVEQGTTTTDLELVDRQEQPQAQQDDDDDDILRAC